MSQDLNLEKDKLIWNRKTAEELEKLSKVQSISEKDSHFVDILAIQRKPISGTKEKGLQGPSPKRSLY